MVRVKSMQELAAAVPEATLHGDEHCLVNGIVYDSRLVQPGNLFAALRGADADGHAFVAEAESRGAAGLLVETPLPSTLPQIVSGSSRAALSPVAGAFFDHPSRELNVIGITGTDGKTTTAHLVDHILRRLGVATGLIGTVAIRIRARERLHPSRQTTPESSDVQRLLHEMIEADVQWAIIETTSHGLAMHRVDDVQFRFGAVTNVTHEHLDFHGSVEEYRRAKGILLQRVAAEEGLVVTNADDPGARAIEHLAAGARIIRYSKDGSQADLRAMCVQSNAAGSQFDLDAGPHGTAQVTLPLLGGFNVANALCAAAIVLGAGFPLAAIAEAMGSAHPVPGRMARIEAGQPFSVVVDYAHTPSALEKVLHLLRGLHSRGRLIVVYGSAGERDVEKRPLQGAVAARLADISVVTSEDPRFEDADAIIAEIAAGAIAAGAELDRNLFCRTDRRDAIALAFASARAGDCVLLAGKGHEGSIIWGREKVPWDEAGVARELLAQAGYSKAAPS